MLKNPTIDKLRDMRLYGMLAAFEEQAENRKYNKLSFDERLGFLAYFILCAISLHCPLITLDQRMIEVAKSLGVKIMEVI